MGKGDMKTRRGKLFAGSFGVSRTKKEKSSFTVTSKKKETPVVTAEKTKKAPAPDTETKKATAKKASKPKKDETSEQENPVSE